MSQIDTTLAPPTATWRPSGCHATSAGAWPQGNVARGARVSAERTLTIGRRLASRPPAAISAPVGANATLSTVARPGTSLVSMAGEPALGPPGFPHRLSAMPNPIAPISHHWLDSTHISFGLVTAGLSSARWKGEVSVFNAREPDEHRADLDLGAFAGMVDGLFR